jgi:protein TonB
MTGDPLFPQVVVAGAPSTPSPRMGPDPRAKSKATLAILLGGVAIALVVFGLRHLVAESRPPARQVARIALLPDLPPPPPPPKFEKKDEPKPDRPAPQRQEDKPRQTPPAPAPLRMEGPAGVGPGAFQAGTVTQDYRGGTPVVGGNGNDSGLDRVQARLYANGVRQALHDELERQLGADTPDLDADVALWISPDGRIARFELQGAKTDRQTQVEAALARCADLLQLAAPPAMAQPMRFRLHLHAA